MGAFSFWHLILLLIVVLLFFGPNRLPNLGHSLGKAIRGFKQGLNGDDDVAQQPKESLDAKPTTQALNQGTETSNKV
ncbi:MAG: twin-arginine translocase TatA/TatE family subunit [Oligoflexia bacterium]|nr:twin-arginine translocase TatA/TatE family subunit [Oligoflexia bacterium]